MEIAIAILTIAGAVTLGAMSPGPSFLMVARTALAVSRADGVAAALGMGLGAVLFALAALLGLHVVLSAVPWLYAAVKALGGAYLLWLGWHIWRGAKKPLELALAPGGEGTGGTFLRSFALGLATQVSNPKTAVVYASIFVSLLPRELPAALTLVLPLLVFVIEAGWYAVVALVLSASSPRATYLRARTTLDRIAGGVMAALGVKLLVEARRL
jgi:threonine/homoserine/homoserine lactone efflux protein